MFGPDGLANFFAFVFLFGLIFTAASILLGFADLGGVHGDHYGGHDFHVHLGGHHAHHGSDHGQVSGHDGPDVLNMPTIMAFVTWFGGVGYILRQTFGLGGVFAVSFALVSGMIGGGIMFVLLARILWPMMSKPLSTSDYSLPGTPARVVSPIRAGGVGEILYTKNGTRFTAGACSADEGAIPKGTEVVILRYEKGLAYVQDVHAILSGDLKEEHAG